MIDTSMSAMAYNHFLNLDSIEDRIIYYLISPYNKTEKELEQVHTIWKILYYNDVDALSKPLPKYSDITKLIYNDCGEQAGYRIFRSPRLEDGWVEECSMLKIYVDSIVPTDHLRSIVNIGIDVVVNTKIINLRIPEDQQQDIWIDEIDGTPIKTQTKSRVTALTAAILHLLNGAEVAGVGKVVFSRQQSIYNQSQYGLWNQRAFEGMKTVVGVGMSGVY